MRRYHSPRVRLSSKNVAHKKKGTCFVPGCENDAEHEILGKNKTKICTKHMSMFFKLPANRFEKQKAKPAKKGFDRAGVYTLRRHMDIPLTFKGERIAWHSFTADEQTWFFSLYWKETGPMDFKDMVLSVTRAFDKYTAIHQVEVFNFENTSIVEVLKYLMHVHGGVLEIGQLSQVACGIEMTRFLERCLSPKSLSPENNRRRLDMLNRSLAAAQIEAPPAGC